MAAVVAELCVQIHGLARAIAQTMPFGTGLATGGRPMKTQKDALKQGVDVLIGTPGRLRELLRAGALSLESCRAVVLDEADLLLGTSGHRWLNCTASNHAGLLRWSADVD